MSHLPINVNERSSSQSSSMGGKSSRSDSKFPKYFRRLVDFRQMDFEATFDQMITLLSTEPDDVFISFSYRKQTKNQWARDDPAFAVVEAGFVAVATLAYAIAFQNPSFWGYLWSVLYGVIVDWLLVGLAVASTTSHIANKYLRQYHAHSVEQEVEWLFAFDVHTNAFFCSFFVTYVLQYFLLPVLLPKGAFPCILSNSLYAVAMIWYAYITHLGYRALSFLGNTQIFLWYPIVFVGFLLAVSILLSVLNFPINITRIVMNFHFG